MAGPAQETFAAGDAIPLCHLKKRRRPNRPSRRAVVLMLMLVLVFVFVLVFVLDRRREQVHEHGK